MKLNDFHYSMFLALSLYNVELLPEDFEEIGLIAYNLIGNKNSRLYTAIITPDCDGLVTLPCNCDKIEAITYNFEDWNYTTNKHPFGDFTSLYVEHYIEVSKLFRDFSYIPGKLVHYLIIGDNQIQIKDNYTDKLFLLYKSESLDDNGLPMITDAEAMAIAAYVAYTLKFKEGILTNNSNILQVALLLQNEWLRKCDAARITELSQNDMNEVLDAKVSWDRKQYNKSFKAIK